MVVPETLGAVKLSILPRMLSFIHNMSFLANIPTFDIFFMI